MNISLRTSPSPFHAGEREMQERVGKRDAMEVFGQKAIRPFMPDQHRDFFEQIPFIFVGSVDAEGWPWASVVTGGPNFITSPSETELTLRATPIHDDPLSKALTTGAPLGLLGIELHTRRRNRMNAKVVAHSDQEIAVKVVQSFGNCPQYIQTHDVDFIRAADAPGAGAPTQRFTQLDAETRAVIASAHSLYVASSANTGESHISQGVDVSHRGGQAGFVHVDGNTLTIPDFAGNNFFNTLGNFLVNPKAGLLFVDYTTGDVLMLTGTVEVLSDDDPDIAHFKGAERGWRFSLDHGLRIFDALPFRANLTDWSPNSLMADTWTQAEARKKAEALRQAWRPLRVTAIQDESRVVRSFTFDAIDDAPLLGFEAGQYLTLRVPTDTDKPMIRTYTVSSAPGDAGYRISVKREPDGAASNHLHDTLKIGNLVEVKAPTGAFFMDALEKRPAVLIAGGVGVTPMMSMTRHALNEGVRKRHIRPLTIFHAARSTKDRAFAADFREAQAKSDGKIRYLSIIGQPGPEDIEGVDFDIAGRITPELIKNTLAYDDYDFFLCGPAPFMQAMYDALRDLGARDARIFAEAFGPAALTRIPDDGATLAEAQPEANLAVVKFEKSGFEQRWEKGDPTLLETAEAHGLSPDFSCRNGSCGSCAVKKLSGEVAYRRPITADYPEDHVLICCAVPADGTDAVVLDL